MVPRRGSRTTRRAGNSSRYRLRRSSCSLIPLASCRRPEQGGIVRAPGPPVSVAAAETEDFAGVSARAALSVQSLLWRQCCQRVQRLLKSLHRNDANVASVLLRVPVVVPSRDEEDV